MEKMAGNLGRKEGMEVRKNRKEVMKLTISAFSMAAVLALAGCQGASETQEAPTEQEQASEPAGAPDSDENGAAGQETAGTDTADAQGQGGAGQETPEVQSEDASRGASDVNGQDAAGQTNVQGQETAGQSNVQGQDAAAGASDVQGQESSDAQQSNTAQTQNAGQNGAQSDQGGAGQISLDEAKQTALADAGAAADAVTFTKEKLDYDDGVSVYEIEFYTSTRAYEYEIDAATGAIISRSEETHHNNNGHSSHSVNEHDAWDSETAKAIAADHAGVSVEEVQFTKVKQDTEDGLVVYEIEFTKDGKEYEYTIDAATGAVLEFEVD